MIELVTEQNFGELLPLIKKYQEFYEVPDPSIEKNRSFFAQFWGGTATGAQFICRVDNQAVGFATLYFSYSSSITSKVAIMNDLYVEPEYRRRGLAGALINHCHAYGNSNGAARLQWVTAKDNTRAQSAYEKLGAKASDWVLYTYSP